MDPKKLKFFILSSLNLSHILKVTEFLAEISEFELLVMTE